MRSRVVWRQLFFDDRQQLAYVRPVLFPGEVDGYAGLFVSGTHPEVVGGYGANFGDHQVRSNLVAEALDREDGIYRFGPWHKEFGLQFFAGAGSEAHTEVWEAFVPG